MKNSKEEIKVKANHSNRTNSASFCKVRTVKNERN